MLRAAQLAVSQVHAKRGIRGRKLELRVVDDSGNEDTAVRVAEQLYADPAIVAVVGHLSSGPSLAAARVYGGGATPTPMISPSASSPDLSGMSPYVFRVCPSDLQHGPELARFAWQTLGARRAGIIYLNNDYGRGVRRTFAAEFARLGGTVLESDPYTPATASLEPRSEEHTSELQSRLHLVCRLLLEKKKETTCYSRPSPPREMNAHNVHR